jgi:hypothetical protein
MIGDKLGGVEEGQLNEVIGPAIAAGARALMPLLAKIGPALGRMASQGGKAAGQAATAAAPVVGQVAKQGAQAAGQVAKQGAEIVGIAVVPRQTVVQDFKTLPADGAANLGDRFPLPNQQPQGLAIERIIRLEFPNRDLGCRTSSRHGCPQKAQKCNPEPFRARQ